MKNDAQKYQELVKILEDYFHVNGWLESEAMAFLSLVYMGSMEKNNYSEDFFRRTQKRQMQQFLQKRKEREK